MTEFAELLFFDTFAHDNTEEINLDLVQFPKPVYITEVRIIPLGARVQADFPGGVRLGATNPSQFKIEFFVNDLGKPGASTFESVGGFEYNQNGCINLECIREDTIRKIPTDGLVLRGWYTTITLAVYGTLTKNIAEQLIQPVVNPPIVPNQPNLVEPQQILPAGHLESEWPNENINIPVEYDQPSQSYQQAIYNQQDPYQGEYQDYYGDAPKDPRNYHVDNSNSEWNNKVCSRQPEVADREQRERSRDILFEKTGSLERDHRNEPEKRERDRDKMYSRERQPRDYRGSPRDSDHDRNKYEGSDREKSRDRPYKHEETCRRSYGRSEDKEREERKRPRTPPLMSPKRPKTPHEIAEKPQEIEKEAKTEETFDRKLEEKEQNVPIEEPVKLDVEEFEPILSDEDILDDNEQYQDINDDFNNDYDDPIRLFVPGSADLTPYRPKKNYEILDHALKISENLKITIGICDDYFKSSITKYTVEEFVKLNTEIKEEFIHLCEKLPSIVGSVEKFVVIAEIYEKIRTFDVTKWEELDKEVSEQVVNVFQTMVDWLKVALNYELANSQDQPIYKIRHIKCGLKMAQFCFESEIFIKSLLKEEKFDVYYVLLELYRKEYMAPSLKLMILKALDTCLMHKDSMEIFLGLTPHENSGKQNGFAVNKNENYKTLLEMLRYNSSVRIKFSLSSILKKINLYEIFSKFSSTIYKLKSADSNVTTGILKLMSKILEQVLQYLENGEYSLTQPKRFLPVAAQFEIVRETTKDNNILIEFFKMFEFVECLVFLLTHSFLSNLPIIKIPVLEVLDNLSKCKKGIEYLASRCDAVNVLLKFLLQSDEEVQYSVQNGLDVKSHSLGVSLAFKMKTQYHVMCLLDVGVSNNYDLSSQEILNELLSLYCLSLSAIGKVEMSSVLGMTENFKALTQFINVKEKLESQFSKLKKTPGILYVIDLIHVVLMHSNNVQLLERYNKEITHIFSFNGQQEVCTSKLNSVNYLTAPVVNNKTLSYDNILPLVEIIRRDIDNLIEKPEEIMTSLRIIYSYGISKQPTKSSISENPFDNFVELKYKHVILQLFSLDGVALMTKILQKLCEHYEQPHVHSSCFMSQQGLILVEIASPSVCLLEKMLTYAIQCRNTNFKDLTAVPVLLQTYNLMTSYAMDSAHHERCEGVKRAIVDTLLVYTQPISEEVHEKDTLNKTLWSLMCKEVIQYISQAPYTFVSGLLVLSELLPLPLPIQTNDELQEEDTSWMINLRKLWAAHLHPHSASVQDFVNKLCTTSCQSLLNLLRRICVQISDLAANSALMISRGILDAVLDEFSNSEKDSACSAHAARLLNFLACLVTHNTLKCAVLSLLQGGSGLQVDQKYTSSIGIFVQILRKTDQGAQHHVQCQECILSIIQSFCDVEISLLQSPHDLTSNVYLSNALPIRNHLVSFVEVIAEHISSNNSFVTYLPAVRTILLLTEHDYGFYHLRECLSKKPGLFNVILDKMSKNFNKDSPEFVSVLNTLMEFFYVSVVKEEVVGPLTYSPRSMRYGVGELKVLIGFKSEEGGNETQPLEVLRETLKGIAAEDTTFEALLEKLTGLITLLNTSETDTDETYPEPLLPNPEPLLAQFSRRLVYNCTDTFNERLTANYWLSLPSNEETEGEIENTTTADLADLCKQNLSDDYNLIREIEILCRITSNNMAEKEKKNEGEKMKKPLVSPLRTRGFPRMVQQRPDLFRSRPPNTSRPPSLHVDDFVALETCGAQPTGPTGYNKISRELMVSRGPRGTRGRAFVTSERAVQYRQMSWWGAGFGRLPY